MYLIDKLPENVCMDLVSLWWPVFVMVTIVLISVYVFGMFIAECPGDWYRNCSSTHFFNAQYIYSVPQWLNVIPTVNNLHSCTICNNTSSPFTREKSHTCAHTRAALQSSPPRYVHACTLHTHNCWVTCVVNKLTHAQLYGTLWNTNTHLHPHMWLTSI